jgi:D-glycero-alpha-D-manno-heptose-7-phosphate kinase
MTCAYEDKSQKLNSIIDYNITTIELLSIIDRLKLRTFFVVDTKNTLIGVVTDGDLRRYYIKHGSYPKLIKDCINLKPIKYTVEELTKKTLNKFVWGDAKIPVVGKHNKLVGFYPNSKSDNSLKAKDKVSVIAPTRVTFAGGGSDLDYWFNENEGCVLNLAIAKYARVNISRNYSSNFNITSYNTDEKISISFLEIDDNKELKLQLIINCIKYFKISDGLNIEIFCDFDPGTGLGGSSSLVTAMIKGLAILFGIEISVKQLIDISYHIEREMTQIRGGWQDQIISAYGGICVTDFSNGTFSTKKIQLATDQIDNLNACLFITKVGGSRNSDKIHREQKAMRDDRSYIKNLQEIVKLAQQCSNDFSHDTIETLGDTLHKGWMHKREIGSFISNKEIDSRYDQIREFGAVGGRLLGAGGSGYLLALVPQDNQLNFLKECSKADIALERLSIDIQGVRTV